MVNVMGQLINFTKKALTYQLKDNDINHIINIDDFYKQNEEICASDMTRKHNLIIYCEYRWQEGSA